MDKINQEKSLEKEPEIKSFHELLKVIKSNWWFFVVILFFTFAIYGNSIAGEFVNLDDLSINLRSPYLSNIMTPLKEFRLIGVYLGGILKIFGVNPHAYHLFSVLMHVINGCLVFILAYILFGKRAAIITTLLFLSHPANTESISWHAGFVYPLRAIAMLLILIFYALFRTSNKKIHLYVTAILLLIGMGILREQGWMFIVPIILVIMDQFIFEDKIRFKNIKYFIPIIVISVAFAATLLPGYFKGRLVDLTTLYYVKEGQETPLVNRIPYTIYMEYKTLAVPYTLSIYHEGKYISNIEYAFMVVVTIAVIYGIFYLSKRNRKIAGLMIMIIFSILPSFSPRIIAWTAAERYLYMPSVFSSMIIATLFLSIEEKIEKKKGKNSKSGKTKFVLYATITLVLLYSIRTVIRNVDYKNSKNLWMATKITAPYSYRVYNNLGDVYAGEQKYDLAIENFKRSVALRPDYADAVHNIGHIYMVLGDYEKAVKYLAKALEMNPRLFMAAYKLGYISYIKGDLDSAKTYFNKCLEYQPTDPDCLNGMKMINASQQTNQ